HYLADAGYGDEMAKRFSCKNQRVEKNLFQIFGRPLLQRFVALLRKRQTAMIGSIGIRREIPAAMCSTNLQSRKTIEGSLENQMGKSDCRSKGISDDVCQHAISTQPGLQFRYALRVKKNWNSELFGLRPKWIEARRRQFFIANNVSHRTSTQSEFPYTLF